MIVIQDRRELIRSIAASQESLIAVDGWHGSGKSWLGRVTARCTRRKWVDLDSLVKEDQKAFVDFIDLRALAEAVSAPEPLLLTGVCMREALARIGAPKALHVYVKRMHLGYWTHEEEAEGRGLETDDAYPPSPLEREVRSYHETWNPHLHAGYVYERSVDAMGR